LDAAADDGHVVTLRIVVLCAVLGISAAAFGLFTASNTVPASSVGQQQFTIDANALKPAFCSSLNLTTVVTGTTGTAGNDLILGPAAGSTLNGNGGKDCIVGGGGNDTINGNGNNAGDFCIGGPGNDTFKKCQNTQQ
jgi:Ca2+-binding RTX toxin-like protein